MGTLLPSIVKEGNPQKVDAMLHELGRQCFTVSKLPLIFLFQLLCGSNLSEFLKAGYLENIFKNNEVCHQSYPRNLTKC